MKSHASFFEAAGIAMDSLRGSKLRSFLTLLGIILSTTTLIAVMSVIHGMDVFIADQATTMGSDGFRIVRVAFVGALIPNQFLDALRKNPEITSEEYDFVRNHVTRVRESGISSGRSATVTYVGDAVTGVQLQGVTANSAVMNNTQVATGRFLNEIEDQKHMDVVFIGADFKERFFPNVDPAGKTIGIDGRPFEVIGVAQPKGSVFGQSQDSFRGHPGSDLFQNLRAAEGNCAEFCCGQP